MVRRRSSPTTRSLPRSEEHTSELQSQSNLVCRLLLEKKKKQRFRLIRRGQECGAPDVQLDVGGLLHSVRPRPSPTGRPLEIPTEPYVRHYALRLEPDQ